MSRLHADVAALAREFARGEIADAVKEGDRYPDAPFGESLYRKAAEVGFLSFLLPEGSGGVGETNAALTEALAVIAKTDASVSAVILCQAFAHRLLMGAGKEDLVGDDGLIAATLYEDPLDLPAGITASGKADSYTLDGAFEYVVLAPVASSYLLPVRLDGEDALFLVKKGKGVVVGEPLLTLGLRACPVADLELKRAKGVLVSAGDTARSVYRDSVEDLRGAVAAIHAGIMAGCLEEATAYARERYQGWKQIIDHGQIRAYLGRIAAAAAVAEELYRSAAGNGSRRAAEPVPAAVQLMVGEMAVESTTNGVQVLGGNGYMDDYGQAKRMRDAKQVQGIFGPRDLLIQDIFQVMAAK
jgi:alkylation response protein AidB-like acyl-CoA dehydrogenase